MDGRTGGWMDGYVHPANYEIVTIVPSFPGICIELFFSFSLVRNVPKLLNTTRTARNVSCLHGIRTLSMMWIILGHCYVYYAMVKNIGEFNLNV